MHELSIAREIIAIVEAEMDKGHFDRVKAIHLRIGALSGVDPEALTFGFEAATMDTRLGGAKLVIQPVPVRADCRACGHEFTVEDLLFLCPQCQSTDVDVTQGEDMLIDHLIVD